MISRNEMFLPLLEADPSFQPLWNRFAQEWAGQDLPQYLALSELAQHLITRLAAGQTQGFNAVFAVVERWLAHGDAYVREAAVIGLLEDLQNEGLHARTRPDDFRPWLLPQSAKWWDRVAAYWAGDANSLREAF